MSERNLAAQPAAELLLDCPNLAESVAQVAASSRVKSLGIEVVVRLDPALDLLDLVLDAEGLEEFESLAQ